MLRHNGMSTRLRDRTRWLLLVLGALSLLGGVAAAAILLGSTEPQSADAAAPQRGYTSRACGFDLDDDGIIGERDDDCNIGDGVTLDPDGDGVNEDIFYVSCQTGSDLIGTGSPQAPFRTINKAYAHLATLTVDDAEDIIAFRGVCSEELTPTVDGVSGVSGVPDVRVKQPTGSEQWPFEFPTNPAMLIGWDFDNDGEYPPYDQDDVAVLHGNPDNVIDGDGLNLAIGLETLRFAEFAHFTVDSYGRDTGDGQTSNTERGGVLRPRHSSHVYVHDLSLLNINKDKGFWGNRITFRLFSAQQLRYFAVINVESLDTGAYFTRGGGGGDGDNPSDLAEFLRFQNISYTAHGCDRDDCRDKNTTGTDVAKIWGYTQNIEWLDSVFDANLANWSPTTNSLGATGQVAAQCSQNWVMRNNEYIDLFAIKIQASSSQSCTSNARPVKNIVFDGNLVRNSFAWNGLYFIDIRGGAATQPQVAEDIIISNNVFTSSQEVRSFVRILTGGSSNVATGQVAIVGNTMSGPLDGGAAAISVENRSTSDVESFDVRNNIITGSGPETIFKATSAPSDWTSNFNVIDPDGSFRWDSIGASDLAAWRTLTGQDASSRDCLPNFVNANGGDFHLDGTPGCALDNGVNAAAVSAIDFERDARPQGNGWDIGADEFAAGAFMDTDGDGFSDADETRLGTNPNSAFSCPVNLTNSGNGNVGILDFGAFASGWLTQLGDGNYLPQADFIESNSIDSFDFGVFAARFGTICGQ